MNEKQLEAVLRRIRVQERSPVSWDWGWQIRAGSAMAWATEGRLEERGARRDVELPGEYLGRVLLFRLWFRAPCVATGEHADQFTREYLVTADTTEDGVIRTVFAALLAAVEHELREAFLVDGLRVFDPHAPIAVLQQGAEVTAELRRLEAAA